MKRKEWDKLTDGEKWKAYKDAVKEAEEAVENERNSPYRFVVNEIDAAGGRMAEQRRKSSKK